MVTSQQFGKCTAIWLGTLNGCFCLATTESCLVSYVCLRGKTYSTSIDRHIQTSCHSKNGKHASLEFLEPWQVPGLTGLHLNPDIMHTKWLGTDQYLLGGVLPQCKGNPLLPTLLHLQSALTPTTFECGYQLFEPRGA